MINVPMFELMKLWGELVECYHGVNGYGGNTAEIYAYRFMRYSPSAHSMPEAGAGKKMEIELQKEAAQSLVKLVGLFGTECNLTFDAILIDGFLPGDWLDMAMRGAGFSHRVYVTVRKRQDTDGR